MALKKCGNPVCREKAAGRNRFCSSCWSKVPSEHRSDIRKGTDKGEHTLRANPTREWMSKTLKYLAPGYKVAGTVESASLQAMKVEQKSTPKGRRPEAKSFAKKN